MRCGDFLVLWVTLLAPLNALRKHAIGAKAATPAGPIWAVLRHTMQPWMATFSGQCSLYLHTERACMNRRKKLNQILKANAKKASAKLAPPSRSKYISKADRLKLEAESAGEPAVVSEI